MKIRLTHLWAMLLCLPLTGIYAPASAQVTTFKAILTGQNEVQPVVTTGKGEARIYLVGNQLTVAGSFSNLSSDFNPTIGAHIHAGFTGQSGPVELTLKVSVNPDMRSGVFDSALNTFSLTFNQLLGLMNRAAYVNVHTVNHPAGEIRGQVLAVAAQYMHATMYGSNEIPGALSGGSGAIDIEIQGLQIKVTGSFMGLEGDFTASHIHTGRAGESGGV
ncbi:MAG: CHRD domain-containing protein, partial [Bacteroidota bacterium]|nr:CHRD domain-containing protein [Bacteroidota bacterium]